MELRGTTALVTGGARRLGAEIAQELAAQGVSVAVHFGKSNLEAERLCWKLRGFGVNSEIFQADLADPAQARLLLDRVWEAMGPVHILINNAAVFQPGDLVNTTMALWDRHLAINLTAPFLLMQSFASLWQQHAAAPVSGKIINLLDQRVERPLPGHLAYTVAKSALWTMTRLAALELAPLILVNGIGPGPILPAPMARPGEFDHIARSTPIKRPGTTADIVDTILFLLRNDYITGELICVDGGQHL